MSVLAELEKLSSAEDFFVYLKVDFDPALLRVARLHILKRMGKYLAEKDFGGAERGNRVRGCARNAGPCLPRLRRIEPARGTRV